MTAWYRYNDEKRRLTLIVHVQPGAKRTEVVGEHGDALKIRLAAPPVEGRANQELIRFLAEVFAVSAANVVLKQGARGRRKLVEIDRPVRAPEALLKP
jgi:uncharacterized protein (TIGR00251 family)